MLKLKPSPKSLSSNDLQSHSADLSDLGMEARDKARARELILISSAAEGNLESFNELVLKYQNLVYNVTCSILDDPDSAEDATQETFIKAFQHLAGFRGGSFRGWLLRIATNSCYDFLRTRKAHPTVALVPEDDDGNEIGPSSWLIDPRPSLDAEMESDEISEKLYRLLFELPVAFRSVIVLVDMNGIDYAEAAQVLHLPIGTVRSRLARARLLMKEKLSQDRKVPSDLRVAKTQALT